MNRTNLVIFFLVVLLGALGTAIYYQSHPLQEQVIEEVLPTPPPEPAKKPIVHYPVPKPAIPTPLVEQSLPESVVKAAEPTLPETLPPVQESDQSIQDALKSLLINQSMVELLHIDNFIQKFVATVDNLPEKRLPRAHLPIKPPGGKFLVAGTTEEPQISANNYQRYAPYVDLFESINQDLTLKIYTYFYPLFQKSYEQLGYQNAYFNDRLVYVIEHLLETPNPADPILLSQPAVLYTYADPALENLSAGQKTLLRIGQEQRLKVFKVLDNYREKLINLHP